MINLNQERIWPSPTGWVNAITNDWQVNTNDVTCRLLWMFGYKEEFSIAWASNFRVFQVVLCRYNGFKRNELPFFEPLAMSTGIPIVCWKAGIIGLITHAKLKEKVLGMILSLFAPALSSKWFHLLSNRAHPAVIGPISGCSCIHFLYTGTGTNRKVEPNKRWFNSNV